MAGRHAPTLSIRDYGAIHHGDKTRFYQKGRSGDCRGRRYRHPRRAVRTRREGTHQVAAADLCRPGAGRACHQAVDRCLQQGRQRRDGDRALLRRSAGADRRIVPGDAEGHDRRGAERRRFDRGAGGCLGVRRLLPVRHPLQPRRAGAVQPVRPERRSGKRPMARWRTSPGSSAGAWDPCHFNTVKPITQALRTSRVCACSPSRPPASSCRASGWCR